MNDGERAMVARSAPAGWHNLAIGEPGFLQEVFRDFWPQYVPVEKLTYPEPEGSWGLRVSILTELGLPPTNQNLSRLVVTNGAKQALLASLYAAREACEVKSVWAPKPYWPSFPTLSSHAGLGWVSSEDFADRDATAKIVTWPNNPSGYDHNIRTQCLGTNDFRFVIWDSVYACDVYGFDAAEHGAPDYDVRIGSLSKMFGTSSARVGWAFFGDADIAKLAASYMEETTSGVSEHAQKYAELLLDKKLKNPERFQYLLKEAVGILCDNQELMDFSLRNAQLSDLSKVHRGGLFRWFKPDRNDFAAKLQEAKVMMVDGKHCGMEGWWRANLGGSNSNFAAACAALKGALES